jgi:hypothetical protein
MLSPSPLPLSSGEDKGGGGSSNSSRGQRRRRQQQQLHAYLPPPLHAYQGGGGIYGSRGLPPCTIPLPMYARAAFCTLQQAPFIALVMRLLQSAVGVAAATAAANEAKWKWRVSTGELLCDTNAPAAERHINLHTRKHISYFLFRWPQWVPTLQCIHTALARSRERSGPPPP